MENMSEDDLREMMLAQVPEELWNKVGLDNDRLYVHIVADQANRQSIVSTEAFPGPKSKDDREWYKRYDLIRLKNRLLERVEMTIARRLTDPALTEEELREHEQDCVDTLSDYFALVNNDSSPEERQQLVRDYLDQHLDMTLRANVPVDNHFDALMHLCSNCNRRHVVNNKECRKPHTPYMCSNCQFEHVITNRM